MKAELGLPKRFEHLKGARESRIPTRFDDIQKEILLDKVKDYFAQKNIAEDAVGKIYKLGSVIGDKLNGIV